MINITSADELFSTIVDCPPLELSDDVYKQRVALLCKCLKERGLTHGAIFGTREHFSNIEYFTKYDCRFEDALFIASAEGNLYILIGNEGWGFSEIIPYPVKRHLYQNFSLQGQPRKDSKILSEILKECGIDKSSIVGLAGNKYFDANFVQTIPQETFDTPKYVADTLISLSNKVINFQDALTGCPDGIRMQAHSCEEIAWAEAAANRSAAVIQRMFKNIRIGIAEYQLPSLCNVGFDAHSMHPICNFGDRSVALGMASPTTRILKEGDPCGFCYGIRGSLTSRVGIAATSYETIRNDLKPYVDTFYKKHFEALAAWYESLHIGITGKEMYDSVMDIIGDKQFGVTLNPGHFIATEEWSNAISSPDCNITIPANVLLQSDIIASGSSPVRTSICEDGIAMVDDDMCQDLAAKYPDTFARMQARRNVMQNCLGITLQKEVLPLSNLCGAMYPYMLNTTLVFSKS